MCSLKYIKRRDMKNILLRVTLLLLYLIFVPITAVWCLVFIIPTLLFILRYWIFIGIWRKEFYAFTFFPIIVPILLENYLKREKIIK